MFYRFCSAIDSALDDTYDAWLYRKYGIQMIWDPGMSNYSWGFESEEAWTMFLLKWE